MPSKVCIFYPLENILELHIGPLVGGAPHLVNEFVNERSMSSSSKDHPHFVVWFPYAGADHQFWGIELHCAACFLRIGA